MSAGADSRSIMSASRVPDKSLMVDMIPVYTTHIMLRHTRMTNVTCWSSGHCSQQLSSTVPVAIAELPLKIGECGGEEETRRGEGTMGEQGGAAN